MGLVEESVMRSTGVWLWWRREAGWSILQDLMGEAVRGKGSSCRDVLTSGPMLDERGLDADGQFSQMPFVPTRLT